MSKKTELVVACRKNACEPGKILVLLFNMELFFLKSFNFKQDVIVRDAMSKRAEKKKRFIRFFQESDKNLTAEDK